MTVAHAQPSRPPTDSELEVVRQVLRECAPGGGFICGASHSVMPGAKHENYLAMLEILFGV